MNYLTPEQVLFIHSRIIAETGGELGVRDYGLLRSAVARPRATFDNQELYPDIFSKAAALLESLVMNHPFLDGNKRAGISAAGLFLRRNGYTLSASSKEMERFVLELAKGNFEFAELVEWFRKHASNS